MASEYHIGPRNYLLHKSRRLRTATNFGRIVAFYKLPKLVALDALKNRHRWRAVTDKGNGFLAE